jgi:hypothetical protein
MHRTAYPVIFLILVGRIYNLLCAILTSTCDLSGSDPLRTMGNSFTRLDGTLGSALIDDTTAQTHNVERSKHEAFVCNVTGYVTKLPLPDPKFQPSTSISHLKKASGIEIPAQHSTAPAAAPSLLGDSLPPSALHGTGLHGTIHNTTQNESSRSTFKFGSLPCSNNGHGEFNQSPELSIPGSQSTFQWSAGESTSIKRKASPSQNAGPSVPRKTSSSSFEITAFGPLERVILDKSTALPKCALLFKFRPIITSARFTYARK